MKKRSVNAKARKSGVALIISVGILALLAMIATSFAINMQLEYKAVINQLNYTKATALAEAGMEKVMADIRYKAKTSAYNEVITTFPDDYTTGEVTLGDGTYEATIEREDQKVNINALDETDYIWIDRLYSAGASAGLNYADIGRIMDYRDGDSVVTTELLATLGGSLDIRNISGAANNEENAKNAPYATIEEVRLVLNNDSKYEKIKDIITVSAPIIRGGLVGKYYKPVTAAFSFPNDSYLGKIIELGELKFIDMAGAESAEESADAEFAGGYLMNKKAGNDWLLDNFGVIYDGYIYILPSEVGSISFSLTADDAARLYIDGQIVPESHNFTCAGWHPVRIEYYDLDGENKIEFKWGSGTYVPAERLGYCVPSYLGSPSAPVTAYNCAGFYKITSTGRLRKDTAVVLAQKKLSATARIFGTWTQTTRAEFSAAWAGKYNDYSDGEILNVNWLDSCPTNAEGTTETVTANALKLGFWDDFDEDAAYAFVNFRNKEGWTGSKQWNDIDDYDSDDNNELKISASGPNRWSDQANPPNWYGPVGETKTVEVNGYYYYIDTRSGHNAYINVEENDSLSPEDRQAPPCCVGWLYVRHDFSLQDQGDFKGEDAPDAGSGQKQRYYTLLLKHWGKWDPWLPYGDATEITLNYIYVEDPPNIPPYTSKESCEYEQKKDIGAKNDSDPIPDTYHAYVRGAPSGAVKSRGPALPGTIALVSHNIYEPEDDSLPLQGQTLTTYWDEIRIIPQSGFFVSTPFCAVFDDEAGEVEWGTISWNGDATLQGRAADALTGLSGGLPIESKWPDSCSNGQSLSLNNAKWFQYRITLTSATPPTAATPFFEDVTITYLPNVEVLYWRTEIE